MKYYLLTITMLFMLNCSGSGTREKIVERYGDSYAGKKKLVLTIVGKEGDEQVLAKTYFFENGQTWKVENYKDGQLHGDSIEWYENGKTKISIVFDKGNRQNKRIEWYEDGTKKMETDTNNITKEYNAKGNLITETTPIADEGSDWEYKLVEYDYYPNGKMKSINCFLTKAEDAQYLPRDATPGIIFLETGKWTSWDEKGNVLLEIDFTGDKVKATKLLLKDRADLAYSKRWDNDSEEIFKEDRSSPICIFFNVDPILEDAWGNSLYYEIIDKDMATHYAFSAGPDKIKFTRDDIVYFLSPEKKEFTNQPIDPNLKSNEEITNYFYNLCSGDWYSRSVMSGVYHFAINKNPYKKVWYRNTELQFYEFNMSFNSSVAMIVKNMKKESTYTSFDLLVLTDNNELQRITILNSNGIVIMGGFGQKPFSRNPNGY